MTEYSLNFRRLKNEKQNSLGAHPNEMYCACLCGWW